MHVLYITHPNGAKERRVFWSAAEAYTMCSELVRRGYTQSESGEGFSRWGLEARS